MEEFRSVLADRLVLTLVDRGELRFSGLEVRPGGQVELDSDARKLLIRAYQERKRSEIEYPLLERKVQVGALRIYRQGSSPVLLRGELERYLPFRSR